uniref:OCEL domain-containing protein n=1 Tax=Castor canadensis TaxID=51338 RepID=A0A8C0WMG1_CASCN
MQIAAERGAVPASRRALLGCPQAARRPRPPRAGRDAPRRTRPPARGPRGPQSGVSPRLMPTREPTQRPRLQPQPGPHTARPRKIVFEDELPSLPLLGIKKPIGAVSGGHVPSPHPVPDYELKYPPLSSERGRSCYVAVFQDQYGEFLELQQEVGSTQAKLQQLEALLRSLPPPRSQVSIRHGPCTPQPLWGHPLGSNLWDKATCFPLLPSHSTEPLPPPSLQKEAQVAARVWRELEKKQTDPSFLDKQARYRYLKGKLRHLKTQIQKFDDQGDSEGSVYF